MKMLTSKIPGIIISASILLTLAATQTRSCRSNSNSYGVSPASTFRTQNLLVDDTALVGGTLTTKSDLTSSLSGTPGCDVGEACLFWNPTTGTGQVSSTAPALPAPTSDDILWRMHYFASGRTTEALTIFSQITGTFDTTAGQGFAEAAEFDTTVTRSAGSNPLVVVGVGAAATGGVGSGNNIAFDALHGVFKAIDDGSSFAGTDITNLTAESITNDGTGTNTLTWSGPVIVGTSGNVQIGTNSASTVAINSTDTVSFAVRTATTGPTVGVQSTASGGRTYQLVSSATGDYWEATPGFEIVDNSASACSTFGCVMIRGNASDNSIAVYSDLILGEASAIAGNGLQAGHLRSLGIAATVACNGTGTPSIVGTDMAGKVTTGVGSTTCTVTFNGKTYGTAAICTATIESATPLAVSNQPTATTDVLNFAALTGGVIDYICIGPS